MSETEKPKNCKWCGSSYYSKNAKKAGVWRYYSFCSHHCQLEYEKVYGEKERVSLWTAIKAKKMLFLIEFIPLIVICFGSISENGFNFGVVFNFSLCMLIMLWGPTIAWINKKIHS